MALRLPLALGAVVVLAALGQIGLLVWIFLARIGYPMDLEWMEGGQLYHAYRFIHGEPIYGPISQGFLPYPYPPLHFVVLGVVGRLVGLDYWSGRALSIACVAAAGVILSRETWRQVPMGAERLPLALAAAGCIAAGFPVTGGWYDIIRNDSMAVALPVVAAGVISSSRLSPLRIVAAALLLAAGVFAKQTSICFVVPIGLFVLLRDRRMGILLAVSTAGASALALLVLQSWTDGWFWYWLMLLGDQPLSAKHLGSTLLELLEHAPFLVAVPLLLAYLLGKRLLSARGALWSGMLVAALFASSLPLMRPHGFRNNLVPLALLAGPVTLILCGDLLRRWASESRFAVAGRSVLLALTALYLVTCLYDPGPYVPTRAQHQQAVALNELIRGLDGGVVIPNHPFLAVRNDNGSAQIHTMPYWDLKKARVRGLNLGPYIKSCGARWAILDGREGYVAKQIRRFYGSERPLSASAEMLTGYNSTPRKLLERNATSK